MSRHASPRLGVGAATVSRLLGVLLGVRGSKHHHDFQRIGYGGAGWTLYRCVCGVEEIDA